MASNMLSLKGATREMHSQASGDLRGWSFMYGSNCSASLGPCRQARIAWIWNVSIGDTLKSQGQGLPRVDITGLTLHTALATIYPVPAIVPLRPPQRDSDVIIHLSSVFVGE